MVTNYPLPSILGITSPLNIAAGSDGALWFTNYWDLIGRITTTGEITTYADPTMSHPYNIAAGPDGALWFTNYGNDSIGRITTAGTVTNYTDPSISVPYDITAGPDGALWFTNIGNDSIGRITTAGTVTHYTDPSVSNPLGITAGPDGALWFTNGPNSIGRITTAGTVTSYTDPSISFPTDITAGPDGALWFVNDEGQLIGRITTSGTVTHYTDRRVSHPSGITVGPDGALWFTNIGVINSIGRITTAGKVTHYTDPSMLNPFGITAGPDGALWFTNDYGQSIGRITAPNDAFGWATVISGLPYSQTGLSNGGATVQKREPSPSCAKIGKTVWYRFTPSTTMALSADTLGSSFDTVLAVYRGRSIHRLTPVACDNDGGGRGGASKLAFIAKAGKTYYFQVGGFRFPHRIVASGTLDFKLGQAVDHPTS